MAAGGIRCTKNKIYAETIDTAVNTLLLKLYSAFKNLIYK